MHLHDLHMLFWLRAHLTAHYFLSECRSRLHLSPYFCNNASISICLFCFSVRLMINDNDFSILLFRVQSVPSDVQKEGLGQTVLRSVFATTTENVTLKLDSVSVLKVSLVTGKQVKVDLWTACGCFRLFLLFLCRFLSSTLSGATSNVWISHRQRKVVSSTFDWRKHFKLFWHCHLFFFVFQLKGSLVMISCQWTGVIWACFSPQFRQNQTAEAQECRTFRFGLCILCSNTHLYILSPAFFCLCVFPH